jgi:hypothetical protein
MRTAAECRARAATLSALAVRSTDVVLVRHLTETSADWTALAASVARMEEWEGRFISGELTPAPPEHSLLD